MSRSQPIIICLFILYMKLELTLATHHHRWCLCAWSHVECRLKSVADQCARNRCIIAFTMPHLTIVDARIFIDENNAPEICSFREWQSDVCVSVIRIVVRYFAGWAPKCVLKFLITLLFITTHTRISIRTTTDRTASDPFEKKRDRECSLHDIIVSRLAGVMCARLWKIKTKNTVHSIIINVSIKGSEHIQTGEIKKRFIWHISHTSTVSVVNGRCDNTNCMLHSCVAVDKVACKILNEFKWDENTGLKTDAWISEHFNWIDRINEILFIARPTVENPIIQYHFGYLQRQSQFFSLWL